MNHANHHRSVIVMQLETQISILNGERCWYPTFHWTIEPLTYFNSGFEATVTTIPWIFIFAWSLSFILEAWSHFEIVLKYYESGEVLILGHAWCLMVVWALCVTVIGLLVCLSEEITKNVSWPLLSPVRSICIWALLRS